MCICIHMACVIVHTHVDMIVLACTCTYMLRTNACTSIRTYRCNYMLMNYSKYVLMCMYTYMVHTNTCASVRIH